MTSLKACLEKLRNDKSSGAAELANKSIQCLKKYVQFIHEKDKLITSDTLEKAIIKLGNVHPMSSILHQLLLLFVNLKPLLPTEEFELINQQIQESLSKTKTWKKQTIFRAKQKIFSYHNILVFSYSSTVLEVLLSLSYEQQAEIKVYIPESRPLNEGHNLAKRLAAQGHFKSIIVGVDMAIHKFIQKCEVVLLGCDTLLNDGTVLNKLGSTSLAVLSNYYSKRLVVVTDPTKMSLRSFLVNPDWKPSIDEKEPSEVATFSSQSIQTTNKYFELVPPNLIDNICIGSTATTKPHLKDLNIYFNEIYNENDQNDLKRLIMFFL